MLADALSRNCRGYTLQEVRQAIADQVVMLWVVTDDAATVAAVVSYPDERSKAVMVWLMGGRDMAQWIDELIFALRRYASESGLEAVQAQVRPGLVRVLGKRGWRQEYTTMRYDQWAE